jgi:hypothetical protein
VVNSARVSILVCRPVKPGGPTLVHNMTWCCIPHLLHHPVHICGWTKLRCHHGLLCPGTSGHVKRPEGTIIENYIKAEPPRCFTGQSVPTPRLPSRHPISESYDHSMIEPRCFIGQSPGPGLSKSSMQLVQPFGTS